MTVDFEELGVGGMKFLEEIEEIVSHVALGRILKGRIVSSAMGFVMLGTRSGGILQTIEVR